MLPAFLWENADYLYYSIYPIILPFSQEECEAQPLLNSAQLEIE